jgi:WXG100 family type VII secretion target
MADLIKVTFESLEAGRADSDATAASLDAQLADLDAQVAPLAATWTGAASEAYEAHREQWRASQLSLIEAMRVMSRAFATSHDLFRAAEDGNVRMFS